MFVPEMLASALRMTIPILLTAMGAIYAERSGVVNIGLEGMMIVGSFWAAFGAVNHGPIAGLMLGVIAGGLLALVHAVATVTFKVDHIVSGVALNIIAYGGTRFASLAIFGRATTSPHLDNLYPLSVPFLASWKWTKPLFSGVSPVIIFAFLLVFVNRWVLTRTRFGLRLRAVGENPEAADTLGVNVFLFRYYGVILSGLFAGLAGAYLAVEHTGMYVEGMTQGKGFIALAAMIFGNWRPVGALGASLLFGFAEALGLRQVIEWIPYEFFKMIPYVLTIIVLGGVIRKSEAPAAVGEPYSRSE